ncbi:hypothetical protein LguiB_006124 [Lonicera macranthoides]
MLEEEEGDWISVLGNWNLVEMVVVVVVVVVVMEMGNSVSTGGGDEFFWGWGGCWRWRGGGFWWGWYREFFFSGLMLVVEMIGSLGEMVVVERSERKMKR